EIQKGNAQVARIYASNAIRKNNESVNLIRLASRVESVASRVQTAVTMKTLTKNMAGVVVGLDKAMNSMNLEQMSLVMDKFESQLEDLTVQADSIDSAIAGTVAEDVPVQQVDHLMLQIADEAGLELNQSLDLNPVPSSALQQNNPSIKNADSSALHERLYKLRNP
ncbi:hypothetical protein BB560_006697, partial [Smittium megazygosporum]